MNYKLLFPTYRNRYRFVQQKLRDLSSKRSFDKALNLGGGEGDYDPMIAAHCSSLISCDINEADVAYASALNKELTNVSYQVENALQLSFPDNHFDLIVSSEVLEHVGKPEQMMAEISRVLKADGVAIITFPSTDFPLTYDPINKLLRGMGRTPIAQGAYAFGHEYLVSPVDFKQWSDRYHLTIDNDRNLSGYLVGLLEMYWTGLVQRIFKANSTNLSGQDDNKITFRPSLKEPGLVVFTDAILWLDRVISRFSKNAIGKGFLVRKVRS